MVREKKNTLRPQQSEAIGQPGYGTAIETSATAGAWTLHRPGGRWTHPSIIPAKIRGAGNDPQKKIKALLEIGMNHSS